MLRFRVASWANGVRKGSGQRMPLDLREAFERGRAYATAYGDLVDAWEIDNEPDISFVEDNPETFTAYFKAISLGLKARAEGAGLRSQIGRSARARRWPASQTLALEHSGRVTDAGALRAAEDTNQRSDGNRRVGRRWNVKPFNGATLGAGTGSELTSDLRHLTSDSAPLVLMAPLALPPGPYLERSLRNDLLSYTDGFNYHYYGYAEDFSGVYRQFEDALASPSSDVRHLTSGFRQLPVFLTEYGYGLLSGEAAGTVEGRVRQWQWFADVLPQVRALRIEGPLAFVAMPYLEQGHNEFGLMMRADARIQRADGGRQTAEIERSARARRWPASKTLALERSVRVADAEALRAAEDTNRRSEVGREKAAARGAVNQRGEGAASPSPIRQTPDDRRLKSGSGSTRPSVVRPLASALRPHPSSFAYGEGSIVLYNFSAETVSGRLELPEGFTVIDPSEKEADGAATPLSQASAKTPAKVSAPGAATPSPRALETNAAPSLSNGPRPQEKAGFEAGGLVFAPEDFGANRVEPWMKRIGSSAYQNAGDSDGTLARWEASPAAAYLWDYAARHPYRSRPWKVQVAPAAPVVIDFVAGDGLTQYKAAGGYVLNKVATESNSAQMVAPNGVALERSERVADAGALRAVADTKSEDRVARRLKAETDLRHLTSDLRSLPSVIRLAPGERLVVSVRIRVQADEFVSEAVEVRFVPDDASRPSARWSTQLVPTAVGMTAETVARFDHSAESAAEARALLLARPLAREEPRLEPQGRWLVTHGVTVIADAMTGAAEDGGQRSEDRGPTTDDRNQRSDGRDRSATRHSTLGPFTPPTGDSKLASDLRSPSSDLWRFRVDAFPEEPLHSARVELPLPAGFRFEPGTVLSLQHRIEAAVSENPRRPHDLSVQVRTANGNLYQVWPWQLPRAEWRPYWLHVDNFTMGFFGRAALPWRFHDNEPVSLVLTLRPGSLPATFEFTPPELLRWTRKER